MPKTRPKSQRRSAPTKPTLGSVRARTQPAQSVGGLKLQVRKYRHQLEIIRQTSLQLTGKFSLEQILGDLVKTVAEYFTADAVGCMLWDDPLQRLMFHAGHGFKTEYMKKQSIPGERVLPIIQSGVEYLVTEDLRTNPFGNPELIAHEDLVTALSVAMLFNGQFLGILTLYSRAKPRKFTQEEIEHAQIFSQQAALAVRNSFLFNELREEAQIAQTLLRVAEDVGTLNTLDEILNRIVVIITQALAFRTCAIFLWDPDHGFYMPVKALGLPPLNTALFESMVLPKSDLNFTAEELRQRSIVHMSEASKRFPMEKISAVMDQRDLQLVPLVTKGKLTGAIVSAGRRGDERFTDKDGMFLRGIAAQAAIAIDDAKLFQALDQSFWDISKALAAAIEAKDHYTHSHSESVIHYGMLIAEAMNLPDKELDLIRKSFLLHDVGKIGIDDQILRKTTPLTPDERKAIEQHPVIGAEILGEVKSLQDLVDIVRHHHERWDGRGYPDQLAGEDIPFLSRILQVADSFDAMTSDRPYRKALSLETAMEQLKANSGKQFDPSLVEVFMRLLNQKVLDRPTEQE